MRLSKCARSTAEYAERFFEYWTNSLRIMPRAHRAVRTLPRRQSNPPIAVVMEDISARPSVVVMTFMAARAWTGVQTAFLAAQRERKTSAFYDKAETIPQ